MGDTARQLTDHFQLLGLSKAFLNLAALRYIPHRAGEPDRTAALVAIKSSFGDDPARFIIGAGYATFELEFSGIQGLAEGCLERVPVLRQNLFADSFTPFGQYGSDR